MTVVVYNNVILFPTLTWRTISATCTALLAASSRSSVTIMRNPDAYHIISHYYIDTYNSQIKDIVIECMYVCMFVSIYVCTTVCMLIWNTIS